VPAVQWVTAQRGSSLGLLDSTFADAKKLGAVLVGPAGVGKTVLARAAAKRFARSHPKATSFWIAGTASASRVPFGAFSHLVEVAGVGEPATVLRAARASLCRQGGGGLLVAVDDAHHLDNLSATLVHQLAVTESAWLILTARSNEPAPDAITTLWKDALLDRVDIEPFSRNQTARLLETVLGGPLESASADRIYRLSQGNPLYLRHLVEGAVNAGSLREVDGVWQLRGEMALTPQLSTLIRQHLTAMPSPVQSVLEYLAVEEPLGVDDLSVLTGRDSIEQAEAAGAVTVTERGNDLVVHPVHPLYTESVRTSLGRLAARRLRTSLVAQLSTRTLEHVSDRLRLAALALDSDNPPAVPDLIASSYEAMRLGDLKLGERLARGALQRSGELAARLPLAHSLAWQGRGRDADTVLAPVNPDELSEWDLMAWTLPKAANQFWMLSESQEAVDFLHDMRMKISEPAALHTIDALSATFAMNAGQPRRAVEVATQVLASPSAQDLALAWAAATATLSSARIGRFDDVTPFAERGLVAQHPGLLRFTIGLGQTTTLLMSGDVTGAEELARHYLGFSEFQQPGRAIGEVLLAHTLMAKGELGESVTLLRQAAAALSQTGYSWGPLALMCLALALGQQGQAGEAAKALRRAESSHGMRSELYAPEFALARAWTLAAARDVRGAVSAARDAARVAERAGQLAVALRALHEAVRLGDTHAVDSIARISAEIDCVIGRLALAHGRALAAGDAVALDAVSVELASTGMISAAADAAAQAAVAYAARNQRKPELQAKARAAELAQRCGGPSTPALERVLSPLPLTDREREIAVMVSEGMTNKAIADRLCVSVRTVEGHIYHACTKLDVPDRTMLGHAVAAATSGHAARATETGGFP
jgi:DNA-binding NarL/FixJ family response regulator